MPAVNVDELKTELRRLIASDQLEQVAERLLTLTAGSEYGTYHKEVVNQSQRIGYWRKLNRQGTEDYADLARTRSKVSLSLLDLVDQFPTEADLEKMNQPPPGVSENQLKRRLFYLLVIGKVIVISFVAFLWATGTFSDNQFVSTVGLLTPVFTAYLAVMFQERTAARYAVQPGEKRVAKSFARTAYGIVAAYPVVLLLILNLRGPGDITFTQMNALLAIAESGLGAYVGKVVFGIFRNA